MLAQLAARLWNADQDSVKLVSSGVNLVYRMTCHFQKNKYLRITHPMLRSHMELVAAIDYQHYLFENGAPICEPVKSRHGNYIEEVTQDGDTFLAHVNEEVQGEVIHFNHSDKQVYQAWGKALAHLHRAAKSYQPGEKYRFLDWQDLWEEAGRNVQAENEVIQQEYEEIDDWLSSMTKNQHDFGLTHGDHRSGNVLFDGRLVHIIDFDEPVSHWYWADMARPFLDLNTRKFHKWKEKAAWFLEGYGTILPFEDEIINYLPWFIRMKNVDIYLWMKNNLSAPGFRYDRLDEIRDNICNPLITWSL